MVEMLEAQVRKMADQNSHDEQIQQVFYHLAESVLELSDEAILAEISEAGADPREEAERTRLELRKFLKISDIVERRRGSDQCIRRREASGK